MNLHENQYRQMTITEHVLCIPDMYIGSIIPRNGMSEGLRYVLLQGLHNSVQASATVTDPYIEVSFEGNQISIEHKGTIPLGYNGRHYIPEMIFGQLYTFNNYNGNEAQNGLGVKLINIYSTSFRVKTANSAEHRYYEQLWQNNSRIRHDPIISEYNGNHDYVKITFELDFKRFECEQLTPEMIEVLGNYCDNIGENIPVYGYFQKLIKEPDTQ